MNEWLVAFLIGVPSSGILGYWLRAKMDDHVAAGAEGRQTRREDLKKLRDALLVFLGPLRAHFFWLENTPDPWLAEGEPSPEEKARLIGEWVYENMPRFPRERRGPPWLIANVAYQLARDDRHFLDVNPRGYELLQEAWDDLEEYAKDLTRRIQGP